MTCPRRPGTIVVSIDREAVARMDEAGISRRRRAGGRREGELFARALAAKDRDGLCELLADPVDFAALTPGRHWVTTSPREAVDGFVLGVWFGPGDSIEELRSVTQGQVGDRESVTYRLGVRRGDVVYAVEQHAYLHVDGGRIDWIRILCSGYRTDRDSG